MCFRGAWSLDDGDMGQLAALNADHRFTRGFMEGQWFDEGELSPSSPKL
jgi:hypothetical protein